MGLNDILLRRRFKILEFFKKYNREYATGKIASLTGTNYWIAESALEDLETEGKIILREVGKVKYWKKK